MIPVAHEPRAERPYECCCCFCRTPTPMWTALEDRTPGEQVACCEDCATSKKWSIADVPTKAYWFHREFTWSHEPRRRR